MSNIALTKRIVKSRTQTRLWIFGSVVLLGSLLGFLQLQGVQTGTSGDMICGGNIVCKGEFWINVPPSVTNYLGQTVNITQLCFGDNLKVVLLEQSDVSNFGLYKADKRYSYSNQNKWKNFNFAGNCLSVGNHSFMINGTKDITKKVKWGIDGTNIDPSWNKVDTVNSHSIMDTKKNIENFDVTFKNGIEAKTSKSRITLKPFIETAAGKRTNITVMTGNMPFFKDKDSVKYNITLDIPKNIVAAGFYFDNTSEMDFHLQDNSVMFAKNGEALTLDFSDVPIKYTMNKDEFRMDVNGLEKVDIDPRIIFSNAQIEDLSISPLTNNSFVLAACDEVNNTIFYQIWDTNGTLIAGDTSQNSMVADSQTGTCTKKMVSVVTLNSTYYAIVWIDQSASDVYYIINNTVNGIATSQMTINTNAWYGMEATPLNSTYFATIFWDSVGGNMKIAINNTINQGSQNYTYTVATASGTATDASISALNSTTHVSGWWTDTRYDAEGSVYGGGNSSVQLASLNMNASATDTYSVSTAALNSTYYVYAWCDDQAANDYCAFKINNTIGKTISANVTLPGIIPATSFLNIKVAAINSTSFVIGVNNFTKGHFSFVYTSWGNGSKGYKVSGPTAANTNGILMQTVAAYVPSVNIGFCGNNYVQAYIFNTTIANWTTFTSTGAAWDGYCTDTTAPTYSLNQTNSTIAGSSIKHSLYWTDAGSASGLSGYIFQFCNGTWNGTTCNKAGNTYANVLTYSSNGEICGEITGYDKVVINSGVTLTVCDKNSTAGTGYVNITVNAGGNISVYGTILGDGSGYIGGTKNITANFIGFQGASANGTATRNTAANGGGGGGGKNGAASTGAGGGGGGNGGTGGAGGNSGTGSVAGTAGKAEGNSTIFVSNISSGGGGGAAIFASGNGANGSALIVLNATYGIINVTGTIQSSGLTPADSITCSAFSFCSSGGGGAGGSIILYSTRLYLSGIIKANGGDGGAMIGAGSDDCSGGGGGGGGRLKFYYYETRMNTSLTSTVAGGAGGTSTCNTKHDGSAGNAGTIYYEINNNLNPTYWVNDTWASMTGNSNWSNVTKVVNSTVGSNIAWCFYVNDTSNNWNNLSCTAPFTYITTSGIVTTCSYGGSGNWRINLADHCRIATGVSVGGNEVECYGSGEITILNGGRIHNFKGGSGCVFDLATGGMLG